MQDQLLQELEQLNLIEEVEKTIIQGFVYAIYPSKPRLLKTIV